MGLAAERQERRRGSLEWGLGNLIVVNVDRIGQRHRRLLGAAHDLYVMMAKDGMRKLNVHLGRNHVAELDSDHRRDIVIGIGIIGVTGAERRSGEKEHQAENHPAKISKAQQTHDYPAKGNISRERRKDIRIFTAKDAGKIGKWVIW
jgi:hypothetical protein